VTSVLALGFLALVVVLLFFTDSGRTALVVGVVWTVLVCAGYPIMNRLARRRDSLSA